MPRRKSAFRTHTFRLWMDTHGPNSNVSALLMAHRLLHHRADPSLLARDIMAMRAAILAAGVVMLVALLEAHVESLLQIAVRAKLSMLSQKDADDIAASLTRRFHNPSPDNIDGLFLYAGIPRITRRLNVAAADRLRADIDGLVKLRHRIAHGGGSYRHMTTRRRLERWHRSVLKFCTAIEDAVL